MTLGSIFLAREMGGTQAMRRVRPTPTFVLMEVGQVLLVCEDDGLVLSDNLAPEALPARGQIPQFFQFTHSTSKTHTHQAMDPAHSPREAWGPNNQENNIQGKTTDAQGRPGTTATLQV